MYPTGPGPYPCLLTTATIFEQDRGRDLRKLIFQQMSVTIDETMDKRDDQKMKKVVGVIC